MVLLWWSQGCGRAGSVVRKDSLRPLASEVSTSRDSGCPADEPLLSTSPAHAALRPFACPHNGGTGTAGGSPTKAAYPFHLVLRLRVLQVGDALNFMTSNFVVILKL